MNWELSAFSQHAQFHFSPLLLVLHRDFVLTWSWPHPKSWTLTFLSHHNLFFFLTNYSFSPGKSALSVYLKPHNSSLFLQSLSQLLGFPGGLVVRSLPANARNVAFDPWIRKILWKGKWQPTPVFLLGKSHGQRTLMGCNPQDCGVGHSLVTERVYVCSQLLT